MIKKYLQKYQNKDIYLQKKDKKLWIKLIMEYQKIIKLLGYSPNQPTNFRTKNQVELSDDVRGTYNTYSRIKLET